jgi:hypothetical protein
MADNTNLKGAAIAVGSAILIAVFAGATQPWWICRVSSCPPQQSSDKGTIDIGAAKATTTNTNAAVPSNQDNSSVAQVQKDAQSSKIKNMSDLLMHTNLQGMDINDGETVADVHACLKLCSESQECKAMTYVYRTPVDALNGACWLKGGVPSEQPNDVMVSATKIASSGG